MRFREKFEALIRKESWCCRVKKEEKSRRVLRLHFLLSTFALGQSCRHLTDRTSRPQRSVSGRVHVKAFVFSGGIPSIEVVMYEYRYSLRV
jgi:hypothetical protein